MPPPRLVCAECATELPIESDALACPECGGPIDAGLELPDLSDGLGPIVDPDAHGVWRYRRAMALPPGVSPVSLGEGGTPVVPLPAWGRAHGLADAFAKLEHIAPTGSFKDRGAAVVASVLRARGVVRAVEDSSGNAGAAMAAYCARAGIAITVYVPSRAAGQKPAQIAATGAVVERIEGSREDVAAAAAAAVADGGAAYASHSRHPMFLEGMKTFAFELIEAFDDRIPDHLVMPVGNGGLLLGVHKALAELRRAGVAVTGPRLHVAQAAGCAPLVQALQQGLDDPAEVRRAPTIAGGVEVGSPFRGRQIIAAVRRSGGSAVAIQDGVIEAARRELAALEGLDVEPTAALAFAAAARLRELGTIGARDRVVVPTTGSGLKDLAA